MVGLIIFLIGILSENSKQITHFNEEMLRIDNFRCSKMYKYNVHGYRRLMYSFTES